MKYRRAGIKLEYSTIQGLEKALNVIVGKFKVDLIVPGRIKPIKGNYPKLCLEYKYNTGDKGVKLLAKSGRAVQEVFIVSNEVDKILDYINNSENPNKL